MAERNGSVSPWVHQFDLKLAQNFYFYTGSKHHKHTIQFGMDIQNFANLLNPWWGNVWSLNAGDGYGNTEFQFQRSGTETLKSTYSRSSGSASTWSMMISARYIF